ncbi:hypothetical protein HPULCUR_003801 [Helicostylum pulchrum]|uniref:Uncharacterized protein n=1 Tax=Helicostylum pulchrum TaxID=562976 RepID=A0ABP9XUF4_9FUNG
MVFAILELWFIWFIWFIWIILYVSYRLRIQKVRPNSINVPTPLPEAPVFFEYNHVKICNKFIFDREGASETFEAYLEQLQRWIYINNFRPLSCLQESETDLLFQEQSIQLVSKNILIELFSVDRDTRLKELLRHLRYDADGTELTAKTIVLFISIFFDIPIKEQYDGYEVFQKVTALLSGVLGSSYSLFLCDFVLSHSTNSAIANEIISKHDLDTLLRTGSSIEDTYLVNFLSQDFMKPVKRKRPGFIKKMLLFSSEKNRRSALFKDYAENVLKDIRLLQTILTELPEKTEDDDKNTKEQLSRIMYAAGFPTDETPISVDRCTFVSSSISDASLQSLIWNTADPDNSVAEKADPGSPPDTPALSQAESDNIHGKVDHWMNCEILSASEATDFSCVVYTEEEEHRWNSLGFGENDRVGFAHLFANLPQATFSDLKELRTKTDLIKQTVRKLTSDAHVLFFNQQVLVGDMLSESIDILEEVQMAYKNMTYQYIDYLRSSEEFELGYTLLGTIEFVDIFKCHIRLLFNELNEDSELNPLFYERVYGTMSEGTQMMTNLKRTWRTYVESSSAFKMIQSTYQDYIDEIEQNFVTVIDEFNIISGTLLFEEFDIVSGALI